MDPNFNVVEGETEQDFFIQMNSEIEKIDDFIYDSLFAFSYYLLRSL